MNLNQLEYFISVAENLNFTKAAEKCYISQTAMTQQIKALEKMVGTPLFIRDKHHVELTNAGYILLKEARIIIDRSQRALKLARSATVGLEGKITVGFISGYGQGRFVEIMREFHDMYPNIQMELIRDNMSILFEKLEKGECDLIFTISPYKDNFPSLQQYYLESYPLLVALDARHNLSKREYITYKDLEEENFIIMQPYRRAKDEAEESMLIYNKGGYFPNIIAMEGEPEILLSMISIGLGISILPEYIIRYYRKDENLVFLPLLHQDGSAETYDFELRWNANKQNPALDRLIELIKNNRK